ncbi:MAG TPA: ferric reductase-like transmembrane domain-containing protein [Patescibacteria group bacterium]|nr:ferric reductase-like transmembrane domain-containing protein [Patescibacteria group bacterium]
MFWLLKHIRLLTYAGAVMFGIAIILYAKTQTSIPIQQQGLLIKYFANTSVLFLYFTLLASPLYATFPKLPLRAVYIKARKALGVTAFFFGLFHALMAFFISIGGFSGLSNLTGIYLISIILGAISLFILTILAITSLKYCIKKLGRYWKPLHRMIYIAGIFILIHATIMGSDIFSPSNISSWGLIILLIMEAIRCWKYIKIRKKSGQSIDVKDKV